MTLNISFILYRSNHYSSILFLGHFYFVRLFLDDSSRLNVSTVAIGMIIIHYTVTFCVLVFNASIHIKYFQFVDKYIYLSISPFSFSNAMSLSMVYSSNSGCTINFSMLNSKPRSEKLHHQHQI